MERKPIYETKVFIYKGHRYKVSHRDSYSPELCGFTYYVFGKVDPDKTIKETKYSFDDAGDFHGGVTYCHHIKHRTNDNPQEKWQQDSEYYEIGCDYAHLGDENRHYNLDYVCFDAENTIDKLIEAGLLDNLEK